MGKPILQGVAGFSSKRRSLLPQGQSANLIKQMSIGLWDFRGLGFLGLEARVSGLWFYQN